MGQFEPRRVQLMRRYPRAMPHQRPTVLCIADQRAAQQRQVQANLVGAASYRVCPYQHGVVLSPCNHKPGLHTFDNLLAWQCPANFASRVDSQHTVPATPMAGYELKLFGLPCAGTMRQVGFGNAALNECTL